MLALLITNLDDRIFRSNLSLRMFNFKFLDNLRFFLLIELKIICLSDKKTFLFPICWIFSWPLPATIKTFPVFKLFIAFTIASFLLEISII